MVEPFARSATIQIARLQSLATAPVSSGSGYVNMPFSITAVVGCIALSGRTTSRSSPG